MRAVQGDVEEQVRDKVLGDEMFRFCLKGHVKSVEVLKQRRDMM